MDDLKYYHASESDVPFITKVYNKNLEALHGVQRDDAVWKKLITDERNTYYIVTADTPVAWFRTEQEGCKLWLDMLQVMPEHHRKGIGRYILHIMESLAKQANCDMIGIHTTADNTAAQALYASAGYSITEIGPCTTADGIDRTGYTYEKEVK